MDQRVGVHNTVIRLAVVALALAVGSGCENGTTPGPRESQLPPILQDVQIAEFLTPAPTALGNGGSAEADLQRAREAYALLSIRPEALYRCVNYYTRADALNGAAELDAEDARKFQAARGQLIAAVTPLYRQATGAAQRQQWSEAKDKFLRICRMLPESNKVRKNVQTHLTFIDAALPQPIGGG